MNSTKFRLIVLFFLASISLYSQDPYIMDGPGEGLGQYGYIEYNAITFARLNRGGSDHVQDLAARWYVGQEYVYWTSGGSEWGSGWNCNTNEGVTNKTTNNFSPSHFGSNWVVGADVYVSVTAKWCDNAVSYSINERHFEVVDFSNTPTTQATTATNSGTNYVVGSFVICKQNTNVTSLRRLFLTNADGTAIEGTDIANDAFKVYYEPATGSETFGGSESFAGTLLGSNSGNTTDNVYGNDNINVPLVPNCTRIYIVYNSTKAFTSGRTINLSVINDGISLAPGYNNSHDLFRIDQTPISASSVVLPVQLIRFEATKHEGRGLLQWSTASEQNNAGFDILRSLDGYNWEVIGFVAGNGNTSSISHYQWVDDDISSKSLIYYRLIQKDYDGHQSFSEIKSIIGVNLHSITFRPNPTHGLIHFTLEKPGKILVTNLVGQVVFSEEKLSRGQQSIDLEHLPNGSYYIQVLDNPLAPPALIIKN
jgi:hypothetical protein